MQEDPLIAFGDVQEVTDLLAVETLDVSKRYDLALPCR
jgi:hypothetical protein